MTTYTDMKAMTHLLTAKEMHGLSASFEDIQ